MEVSNYQYEYVCGELAAKELDYNVLKKQYEDLLDRYFTLLDKSDKSCADCNVVACLCEDNKKLRLENYDLQKRIVELENPYKREPRDIDDLVREIESFNPEIGPNRARVSAETMRDWCVEAIEMWRMGL